MRCCLLMQARLEQQLKSKLLTLLAQKGSMTQEVSGAKLACPPMLCDLSEKLLAHLELVS
jgi:hypothetical protein